jgi:heme oxygenase
LRQATADLHTALETEAKIEPRLRNPASRVAAMQGFLALHRMSEAVVEPYRAQLAALGYPLEGRSALITEGLARLDDSTPAPVDAPAPRSFGEALGWLYVAEGSMLGGRIMRRAMVADGIDLDGLDFLDPWSHETGGRWRAFLTAVDAACAEGRADPEDVQKGGRDAFRLAYRLLVPPIA